MTQQADELMFQNTPLPAHELMGAHRAAADIAALFAEASPGTRREELGAWLTSFSAAVSYEAWDWLSALVCKAPALIEASKEATMRRTFDRAALRRLDLVALAALAAELAATPRPVDRAARERLARYRAAVAAELAHHAQHGQPTPTPHKGRSRRLTPVE